MNNKPLVSAIIIFLNAEQYIQEAIESVFAQTYERWELLLVDDGSTDGSTEIALRYAERHPGKVRYLEHLDHQNRGMSATRNLGFRNARGEFVALLDADDVWLPQKLEQQVARLVAHPEAGMIYAPTQYWYSWTNSHEDISRDFVPPLGLQPDRLIKPPTLLKLFLQEQAKPPGTCSVLMRREMVERLGGFEESFRGMYEDQAFFAKVSLTTPVFVVGDYSARYRQHLDSCCSVTANAGRYQAAEEIYLRWLARYVFQQKNRCGEDWASLEKILSPYRQRRLDVLSKRVRRLASQVRGVFDRVRGSQLSS